MTNQLSDNVNMSRKRGSAHLATGPASRESLQNSKRRFKARRKRDIDEARRLGADGPAFKRIAADYLRGYGNV